MIFDILLELIIGAVILVPLLTVIWLLFKLIIGTKTYIETVKVNRYGVNANIVPHILDDAAMRQIGFTDFDREDWYFVKSIGDDITFNVLIDKKTEDIDIQIIDEPFLQPYDYINYKHTKVGREVNKNIVKWMNYLQYNGVISGYCEGDFIS